MKKVIRIIIVTALVAALGTSVIYGQNNKKSYVNDVDLDVYLAQKDLGVLYHHYPFDEKYDLYGNGDKVHSLSDLENESALIVKAKLSENFDRVIYEECVFSEIEIKEVFKGDLQKGEKINIFEPANCTEAKTAVYCSEGYSLMQTGEEYILFLKPLKNSRFGKDDYVYVPSTVTYSKYKINNKPVKRLSEKKLDGMGNRYKYSEVKDMEVYLYDPEMLTLFASLKKDALKKYK